MRPDDLLRSHLSLSRLVPLEKGLEGESNFVTALYYVTAAARRARSVPGRHRRQAAWHGHSVAHVPSWGTLQPSSHCVRMHSCPAADPGRSSQLSGMAGDCMLRSKLEEAPSCSDQIRFYSCNEGAHRCRPECKVKSRVLLESCNWPCTAAG